MSKTSSLLINLQILSTDGIHSLAEELSYLVVNTTTSQSHHAENCAKRFHEAHTRAGEALYFQIG